MGVGDRQKGKEKQGRTRTRPKKRLSLNNKLSFVSPSGRGKGEKKMQRTSLNQIKRLTFAHGVASCSGFCLLFVEYGSYFLTFTSGLECDRVAWRGPRRKGRSKDGEVGLL